MRFRARQIARGGGRRIVAAAALAACLASQAAGLDFVTVYSPLNHTRPVRPRTEFIILHTTEGSAAGALEKLRRNGEAHYMVAPDGRIYRIIDRSRLATHCGRSMWNGRQGLDEVAIGIEVVGFYNRPITRAQTAALRELVTQLKAVHRVPDDRVLTHSMVAYGEPNAWFARDHRGRKRCGALFASDSVRRELGLGSKPAFDPDVRSGRLAVGDPDLARYLYGPDADVGSFAAGQRTQRGASGRATAAAAAPRPDPNLLQTYYFLPDGRVCRADTVPESVRRAPPPRTFMLSGYTYGGQVAAGGDARVVAGPRWQAPTTIYRMPDGRFTHGGLLKSEILPVGTLVFFRV